MRVEGGWELACVLLILLEMATVFEDEQEWEDETLPARGSSRAKYHARVFGASG